MVIFRQASSTTQRSWLLLTLLLCVLTTGTVVDAAAYVAIDAGDFTVAGPLWESEGDLVQDALYWLPAQTPIFEAVAGSIAAAAFSVVAYKHAELCSYSPRGPPRSSDIQ